MAYIVHQPLVSVVTGIGHGLVLVALDHRHVVGRKSCIQ